MEYLVLMLALTNCWLVQLLALPDITNRGTADAVADTSNVSSSSVERDSSPVHRHVIYTYFESLDELDFTGMSLQDHHDMLQFWNQTWRQAGWKPVILTREDVQNEDTAPLSSDFTNLSAWTRMLLSRWMAISHKGGGWYCDYDVFPLYSYSELQQLLGENRASMLQLPNVLTLHEIVAPTLVSGSTTAWKNMTHALLKHALRDTAQRNKNSNGSAGKSFWTDTLALLDIRHEGLVANKEDETSKSDDESLLFPELHAVRHVVQADRVMDLLLSDGATESTDKNRCRIGSLLRMIKKQQWAIHFGPLTLQRAPSLPAGTLRIPSQRLQLARQWMRRWRECRQEAQLINIE